MARAAFSGPRISRGTRNKGITTAHGKPWCVTHFDLLHEIIKHPQKHVFTLQHRKDYGAALQFASAARFRVCLEVQKLIFKIVFFGGHVQHKR